MPRAQRKSVTNAIARSPLGKGKQKELRVLLTKGGLPKDDVEHFVHDVNRAIAYNILEQSISLPSERIKWLGNVQTKAKALRNALCIDKDPMADVGSEDLKSFERFTRRMPLSLVLQYVENYCETEKKRLCDAKKKRLQKPHKRTGSAQLLADELVSLWAKHFYTPWDSATDIPFIDALIWILSEAERRYRPDTKVPSQSAIKQSARRAIQKHLAACGGILDK